MLLELTDRVRQLEDEVKALREQLINLSLKTPHVIYIPCAPVSIPILTPPPAQPVTFPLPNYPIINM